MYNNFKNIYNRINECINNNEIIEETKHTILVGVIGGFIGGGVIGGPVGALEGALVGSISGSIKPCLSKVIKEHAEKIKEKWKDKKLWELELSFWKNKLNNQSKYKSFGEFILRNAVMKSIISEYKPNRNFRRNFDSSLINSNNELENKSLGNIIFDQAIKQKINNNLTKSINNEEYLPNLENVTNYKNLTNGEA